MICTMLGTRFGTTVCTVVFTMFSSMVYTVVENKQSSQPARAANQPARAEPASGFRVPWMRFRADLQVKIVVVCDASAGQTPPPETQAKHKDHQCQLPFLAEGVPPGQPGKVGLIRGQSQKITKMTHASFDSESINNVDVLDLGVNINELNTETQFGVRPKRSEKEERSGCH